MQNKKTLLKVVLAVTIVVVFIWIIKDPIMSHYVSNKMGSDFSVSRIGVTPSHMTIDNLRIKNPPGFKLSTAFSAKNVRLEYSLDEIRSDPAYINYMELNDAFLTVECISSDCQQNNWTVIASNKSQLGKGYTIDKVVLRNVTVEVLKDGEVKKEKTVPLLEFDHVSSEEGFPIQALVKEVFQSSDLTQYDQGFSPPPGADRRAIRRTVRRQNYYIENK